MTILSFTRGSVQKRISRQTSIGTTALLVAGFTLLSTLTAFVRELLIGRSLGATGDTDAFFAAFAIVTFVFLSFTGGTVQGAFLPTYQKLLAGDKAPEADGLLWKTSGMLGAIGILLSIGLFVFSEQIIGVIYSGFDTSLRNRASSALQIMAPLVTFAILGNLAQSALHARSTFLAPAVIPVLTNVAVILALLLVVDRFGVGALSIGYLIGYLPWLILFISILPRRTAETVSADSTRAVLGAMLALGLFAAFDQMSSLVQRSVLSWFEPGILSAFAYGSRFAGLPISILIGALGIVLFPRLARESVSGNRYGSANVVYVAIFATLAIILPASIIMAFEASTLIGVFYGSSAMSAEATRNTTFVFAIYAVSLPAQALIVTLCKVYMAAGRNRLLLIVSVSAGGLQIGMTYAAASMVGWQGIPLATLAFSYVYCAALLICLSQFSPMPMQAYFKGFAAIAISSMIAIGVAATSYGGDGLLVVAVRGAVVTAVFAATCIAFGERSVLQLFTRELDQAPKR